MSRMQVNMSNLYSVLHMWIEAKATMCDRLGSSMKGNIQLVVLQ